MRDGTAVAVVLAGGTSRRFGGGDKTAAGFGAGTVLGALLASLPPGLGHVVVGPDVDGGPAAALAAGCGRVPSASVVVAVAGDHPFGGDAVTALLAALAAAPGADGAVGVDPAGRRQPLLAAYRRPALLAALGPDPAGRSLRSVLAGLTLAEVPVGAAAALDVDTGEDLARARALLADRDRTRPGNTP